MRSLQIRLVLDCGKVVKTSQIITQKWPNVIRYSPECYSIFALIFASRLNNSTPNHQFFASSTIRLRHQAFMIHLDNKSRSGIPLCQNLLTRLVYPKDKNKLSFGNLVTKKDYFSPKNYFNCQSTTEVK